MSLTSPVPDEQGVAYTAFGQPCFFCGEPCSDPAVGASGAIYLHPRCVTDLTIRLYRDLHELEHSDYSRRLRDRR